MVCGNSGLWVLGLWPRVYGPWPMAFPLPYSLILWSRVYDLWYRVCGIGLWSMIYGIG